MPSDPYTPTVPEDVPRDVVVLESDYPDGFTIPRHSHRRGQLLYGASGVVMATTPQGTWMMPPQRGMWIPPSVAHEVRMIGAVTMRSLYVEAAASEGMPATCQVVEMTTLMRTLLAEAIALPRLYDLQGREGAVMSLAMLEIRRLPALPLSLPMPAHTGLADLCRGFVLDPDPHVTIGRWSEALGLSRRSFTRLFRAQTGLSFVTWRQQACLMAALPRLAAGEAVTTIALDLGYDNPAAFSAMFRRLLGAPPRAYRPGNARGGAMSAGRACGGGSR